MSDKNKQKSQARKRRQFRVRRRVVGTEQRPRLAVFRSNRHVVAQVIDDARGVTLAQASSLEGANRGTGGNRDGATKVGQLVAERAKAAGVTKVVFDRGGNAYHGRIAALADAARAEGLEF